MEFDKNNKIVKLCAEGMDMEGRGDFESAKKIFEKAWEDANTDIEKFVSAHYVARHQGGIEGKLKWDNIALKYALNSNDESSKGVLPSLYLNIGKCYEDLNDKVNAIKSYQSAMEYIGYLQNDGYGNMIKTGIENGIKRINNR